MAGRLLTSGEVAQQLGVARAHLLYLIESGKVPGPSLRVPGRRLFTSDDVHCIAQVLAERGRPTLDPDRPAE
jgi:excisionase family DNA binding protein